MNMKDLLPRIPVTIHYNTISALSNPLFIRYFPYRKQNLCQHVGVFPPDIVQGLNVLLGDKKIVDRSLGLDVLKSENILVFVNYLGVYFLLRYFAENAIRVHDIIIITLVLYFSKEYVYEQILLKTFWMFNT